LRGQLKERPSAIFKRHVKVTPFGEDDTVKVIEEIGTSDCIVLGSDWPHPEGLKEPGEFLEALAPLAPETQREIMRETGRALVLS